MVLAISIFACQTKIDFTTKTGFLLVALIAFMGFGFMMIFFHNDVCNVTLPFVWRNEFLYAHFFFSLFLSSLFFFFFPFPFPFSCLVGEYGGEREYTISCDGLHMLVYCTERQVSFIVPGAAHCVLDPGGAFVWLFPSGRHANDCWRHPQAGPGVCLCV